MSVKIAINGLGRIGRAVIRAVVEKKIENVDIVAANGSASLEDYALLLQYDSVHGKLGCDVTIKNNSLNIGTQSITVFNERNPEKIPWSKKGVEIVFECTGKFKSKNTASKHIQGTVNHVIISAPSDDADATIVCGVNDSLLKEDHKIISIGSCTTNALAPIAKLLHHTVGIKSGYMTTIHAYTNDQNILDNSHKDIRRARSCSLSMIPTSTGAAKSIGIVIPELQGRLSGSAIRVPVPNVSIVDLSFLSQNATSTAEINNIVSDSATKNLLGIISVAPHKLVSIDFNHDSSSSIFDPFETQVVNSNFVRVLSWYDNEWGFANRMLDVAQLLVKLKKSNAKKY